jgi:hypothetical protein
MPGRWRFAVEAYLDAAPPDVFYKKGFTMAQRGSEMIDLERHEAKYLIPPSLMPAIRDFIRPFCDPDDNAKGPVPEYLVTTLQLDSPDLALYHAKEHEALGRFKLRVRTYGTDGACPVFMEIKRKIRGVIVKSRATMAAKYWGAEVCTQPRLKIPFRSTREEMNYLNFVRLTREIGARPVVLIRYIRESYLGRNDQYSRLTFDRALSYRPARDWTLLPSGGHWWPMDSATILNRPFSGVILEMKTFGDAPLWMVDLVQRFSLVRIGFCKYFTAVRLEKLFQGHGYSDSSESCGWD